MFSREEQETMNFDAEDNSELMAAADWMENGGPNSQQLGLQSMTRPSPMDVNEVLTQ